MDAQPAPPANTGASKRSGFAGPEAAQIAAHNTRDKKVILSPDQILAAQKIADEFGNQADKVVTEARQRSTARAAGASRQAEPERVRPSRYARDRSFEREAVNDERALFRDALRRGMGETTYPEVRASFGARVTSGEFQTVLGQKHETGRKFTTTKRPSGPSVM